MQHIDETDTNNHRTSHADILPRLMVLAAAAIWGSTYTVSKFAMESIGPQWLLAVRTLTGAALLGVICRRRLRGITTHLLVAGIAIAALYYAAFLTQMLGLTMISPGRSAFLSALYCVFIPLIQWVLRRRSPGIQHIISSCMCLFGVWFVSNDTTSGSGGTSTTAGDLLTIAGAIGFACYFYMLEALSHKNDPLVLTFLIFAISGTFFLIGALATEHIPTHVANDSNALWYILYLVIASLAAQVLQNVALPRTSAMEASVILSTDTLFALAISMMFFGERPGRTSFIGFCLIFFAVLLAVFPSDRKPLPSA